MRLIDADALKKEWRMGDVCDTCDQDVGQCGNDYCFSKMDVCAMIDDTPTVNGWISVKDRLPEATKPDANGNITFSDYVLTYQTYKDGFSWVTTDACRVDRGVWMHEVPGSGCKVTHWMTLPEPPKEDKDDA